MKTEIVVLFCSSAKREWKSGDHLEGEVLRKSWGKLV